MKQSRRVWLSSAYSLLCFFPTKIYNKTVNYKYQKRQPKFEKSHGTLCQQIGEFHRSWSQFPTGFSADLFFTSFSLHVNCCCCCFFWLLLLLFLHLTNETEANTTEQRERRRRWKLEIETSVVYQKWISVAQQNFYGKVVSARYSHAMEDLCMDVYTWQVDMKKICFWHHQVCTV